MKKPFIIFSQLREEGNIPKQLSLPLASPQNPAVETKLFSEKAQIGSIPSVSPKQRNRYRVVLGREILGERLTLDEAIALANQSTHL